MKAYKCPKCGYLNIPDKKGRTYGICPKCYPLKTGWELIEIIDWDKELLTKTEEK